MKALREWALRTMSQVMAGAAPSDTDRFLVAQILGLELPAASRKSLLGSGNESGPGSTVLLEQPAA